MHDEHPPIHDLRPVESSVYRRAFRTQVRSEAMTQAIERRIAQMRAWHADPENEDVSFFDLHPEQFDFAAAVTSIESRRAALKRQSAKTATGAIADGGDSNPRGS